MTDDFELFSDSDAMELAIDADIALITAYLARELSPVQIVAVEARLTTDGDFRRTVQPIVEGWLVPGSFGASAFREGPSAPTLTRAELDSGWQRVLAEGASYRAALAPPAHAPVTRTATDADAGAIGVRHTPARIGRIAAIITLIVLPLFAIAQVARYLIDGSHATTATRKHGSSASLTASPLSQTRPVESLGTISGEDLGGWPPARLTRVPGGRGADSTVRMMAPARDPLGESRLPTVTIGGSTTTAPITCPARGDANRLPFDGIVAVVRAIPIIWYDVCSRMQQTYEEQWRVAPPTKDALRAQIDSTLSDFVDAQLMLVKAKDLGIVVPDSEVNPEGLRRFQATRNRFPTQAAFERTLAGAGYDYKTPDELQRYFNEQVRQQKTFTAILRKLSEDGTLPPLTVAPEEQVRAMRRYLDRVRKEVSVAVYLDRAYALAGVK